MLTKWYLVSLISITFFLSCNNDPASTEDTEQPIVSILYPANNSEFNDGTIITILAEASDNNGIREVNFYIDGVLEFTDSSEPYQYAWNTTGRIDSHTIEARAFDTRDNVGCSEVLSVQINEIITDTLIDIDGNVYQIVKIGEQWWMAENMKSTHAADGSLLTGIYAYNDNENNVNNYGRLYTWQAALDAEPSGWHLPTDAEWDILESALGSEPGTELKEGGSSGFNAKMAGYRSSDGGYDLMGQWTMFWSSTPYTNDHSYVRNLFADQTGIVRSGVDINAAISVRYIKDE